MTNHLATTMKNKSLRLLVLALLALAPIAAFAGAGGGPGSGSGQINVTVTNSAPSSLPVTGQFTQSVSVPSLNYGYAGFGSTPSRADNTDTIFGYTTGLISPSVTIGYSVGVTNNATGASVPQNSSVPVGTVLKFTFNPYVSQNIFWFGTGYSNDSPYGYWTTNATPPARASNGRVTCDTQDYISTVHLTQSGYDAMTSDTIDIYVPFEVNPATRTLTSTTGLTCQAPVSSGGAITELCTVSSAGAKTPTFSFGATYGYFYYRYYDYNQNGWDGGGTPRCFGNQVPMSTATSGAYTGTPIAAQPGYQVVIPAMPISWPLTATTPNGPPTAPTITGPTTINPNTSGTYGFTSTDPDADTIRYGIDWNNDGTVDEFQPASGYVASGVQKTDTMQWSTSGAKTFKAYAQDSLGNTSGWSSYSVTVNTLPQCSDGVENDTDGLVDYPADPGCTSGSDNTESPNPPVPPVATLGCTPASCTGVSGAVALNYACTNSTSATLTTYGSVTLPSGTKNPAVDGGYTLTCTGAGGTDNDSKSVTFLTPTAYITADPDRVSSGNSTTLSWSAAQIGTTCSVTGPSGTIWGPTAAVAGVVATTTQSSGAITKQSLFTISCDSGAATDQVIVNIVPKFEEF